MLEYEAGIKHRMSTERHHSRKRQGITIDAEAKNETIGEAAAEPVNEPSVEEAVADAPVYGRPADETAPLLETAKPSPAVSPGRSTSSALTGGILGAVVALAGAYGLQVSGILPAQKNADSSISDRISAIEANIASGTSSEGERIAALTAEVSALKDSVAALSQAAGDSSVADRVTALEQSASMEVPATNGGDVTALASRVATLESKSSDGSVNEALTTAKNALTIEINSLKSDLETLKTELSDRASEPGLAAAVAATALRAAVDRGGPFGAELGGKGAGLVINICACAGHGLADLCGLPAGRDCLNWKE